MKKFYVILIGVILNLNSFAEPFISGKHYVVLPNTITNQPQVVEFFSFLCQHCYQFEHYLSKYTIPKKINLVKYHINFEEDEDNFNEILTHTWAIAMALGIEDKVINPIFNIVQNMKNITGEDVLKNKEKLKNVFIKSSGISFKEYETLWDSFTVKMIIDRQKKANFDFNVNKIPVAFVNGKYMINISELSKDYSNNTISEYFNIIKLLMNKK
ncbi:protein disulfide oxidoreductase DsbA [Candidatus Pantoea edessiphila]|uniref:Thiol:disulfide interchange protein n=1 Tax=Candidatus Pantoea edessiphila TaxID=2044610 RepID=A0A2P5T1I0_9GAMM|nr:DsbA family protein [Candidatus Pantoea edessiphila]PPI88428.1 protein disulfide oxidoreductase DsbA [Candidatus Pantoea edessiphila]